MVSTARPMGDFDPEPRDTDVLKTLVLDHVPISIPTSPDPSSPPLDARISTLIRAIYTLNPH